MLCTKLNAKPTMLILLLRWLARMLSKIEAVREAINREMLASVEKNITFTPRDVLQIRDLSFTQTLTLC
jgi:hypothetical protein